MNRKRKIKRKGLWIAGAVVVVLLGVVGLRLFSAFSLLNSGEQIDVGGRNIFVRCQGSGAPTVILEHGLGSSGTEWETVQNAVAADTKVCFTSRAGMGFSDPVVGSPIRSAQDAVDDLSIALDRAGIPGPYVLVGHSFGGNVVRLFADQHPDSVMGIVLVDSAHEHQAQRLQELMSASGWAEVSPFFGTGNPERMDFEATASEMDATSDLGDMPLMVLQAAQQQTNAGEAGISQAAADEIDNVMATLWPALQNELASLSSQGHYLLVENSGHFIHQDQPDAVIDAITSVIGG